MLESTYPLVHQKLKREVINGYSLLYTWLGSRPDLEPVMLMAHQDVVSADPTEWTHPPFDGKINDGFIWGRGTLDIKNQLIGIMEAAETLLQQGYRPERTILFGLGHDEETGGVNGCKILGQLFKERGIHLAGIVDEGGGIMEGLAAGGRGPMALETDSWLNRVAMGLPTAAATVEEAHRNLMLTKALDLSAKRKQPVKLPLDMGALKDVA